MIIGSLNKEDVKEAISSNLRMAFSIIPGVGPVLVEAFFDAPARIAFKRQYEHIESVIEKIKKVQETLIDLEYIQTEDFSDIIQHILKNTVLRKAKERAEFFSRLSVVNALKTRPTASVDWQFQFVQILANLNDSEMNLLIALEKHPSPSQASLRGIANPFGLEKVEFQLCFDSLISKGLVFDAGLSAMPKMGVGINPVSREYIDISPLGKKIIQFVMEVDAIENKAMTE